MQSFTVGHNEAGQRFDKYLGKLLRKAPKSFLYKMLRKKYIVLNDKKADGSEKTAEGDIVKLYLADATIAEFTETDIPKTDISKTQDFKKLYPSVLYEDENVMFLNKPQGILSQKAEAKDISLVEIITDYLLKTGKVTSDELRTFHPSICNRLDRNTSGIVACGISLAGSQQLSEMFRERSMQKHYLCLVSGSLKEEQHLKGYLVKDSRKNQVQISDASQKERVQEKDALPVDTAYTPLAGNQFYTLLLVDLITGRSHQIRAHLASIGHPIVGDTKYGKASVNRKVRQQYGITSQMLHAWRMHFPELSGVLKPLSDKTIYAELPDNFRKVLKGEGISWQHGQEEDFGGVH